MMVDEDVKKLEFQCIDSEKVKQGNQFGKEFGSSSEIKHVFTL